MPYLRDPLSVAYDEETNLLLNRLYGETTLPAWAEAFVEIPPDDIDGSLSLH
jgi:hypothetical protein